ncbi:MAG TPA: MarR family transcriptional regulator [Mycobacteriales bacterium]|nr:MarR family transcriptional regulator [Mycobacteriales bacterium]
MTPRSTALGEARDTAALLMAVTERTRRNFEDVAATFDLTPQQARALLALESAAPMRALADHMHCDASNITGIADRLESRGFVARAARDGDRRVKMLALTADGKKLRSALEAAIVDASPVMTALDSKERATLRALLAKAAITEGSRT